MATYFQWRRSIVDNDELKRVSWVCGAERVLVEEITDYLIARFPESVAFLDMGTISTHVLWESIGQYALDSKQSRLFVVRNVESVVDWTPLLSWLNNLRQYPSTYLVFVSDLPDFPREPRTGPSRPGLLPHIEAIKSKRMSIVRCSRPNFDDCIAWVQAQGNGISLTGSRAILEAVGGDLRLARNVALKGSTLGTQWTEKTILALGGRDVSTELVDTILTGKKGKSLDLIDNVSTSEYSAIIGLLDSRLDFLSKLNLALTRSMTVSDIAKEGKLSVFLSRKYMGIAKLYDSTKVAQARKALAVADDPLQSGMHVGVLETLVSLW